PPENTARTTTGVPVGTAMKPTDVRIKEVSLGYEGLRYRTPIKFGGVALDRVTILNAEMTGETRTGKVARGFGSMPLGNVWAWPTRQLTYDQTLGGMKAVAGAAAEFYRKSAITGHPFDITY